jgi:hypothetical protein
VLAVVVELGLTLVVLLPLPVAALEAVATQGTVGLLVLLILVLAVARGKTLEVAGVLEL